MITNWNDYFTVAWAVPPWAEITVRDAVITDTIKGLSARARKCVSRIRRDGIDIWDSVRGEYRAGAYKDAKYFRDLAGIHLLDLLDVKNCGILTANEIADWLESHGVVVTRK